MQYILLDDWDLNEKLKVNLGFRLSMYQHIGPFTRYYKNPIMGLQIVQELMHPLRPLKLILDQNLGFLQDIY